MDTETSLKADLAFCRESPEEFNGRAAMVRTVAALNQRATRKQFIEAMVSCGVNADTARIQFAASRKLSVADGEVYAADGSNVNKDLQ